MYSSILGIVLMKNSYMHSFGLKKRLPGYQAGLIILYWGSVLLLLNSCHPDHASEIRKKIFRYNQVNLISSLDPAFARNQPNIWATDQLYNGLVQLDDSLLVKPAVAKNWEISKDGKTYVFHLRTDVFFHNNLCFPEKKGRKVAAADFVYSFGRIIDTKVASPGSWIFLNKVDSLNPFEAINDSTFALHLNKPFRPMLSMLTMQYCSVVPREAVDYYQDKFRENPVGTGPFTFKRWIETQGLFLEKNEHYFEIENGTRLPYLDGIRVYFMSDRKTAYLEMLKGKVDFSSGIESSVVNELITQDGDLQPKQNDRLQLIKSPYLNTEYLGITCLFDDNNPLRFKKVRQALNYGFDREQMLYTLRNSMGKPASAGFAPRGLPSFDEKQTPGYRYDPEKARQLLAAAGFPNGKGMPPIRLITNKDYLDICTFITRQWEDLGVKVNVDVMETATMREMMTKGKAPFFRASWIADYPDAESFYTVFYSKNPAPPNYTRFDNKEYDQIYEKSLNANDDQERYRLYHALDKILIEEAPLIFLFYDETSRFARIPVKGLGKNAMNLLSLKRVKM